MSILFVSVIQLMVKMSLCTTAAEKDLGVVIDQNLKFHQQATAAAAKANGILGLISKVLKILILLLCHCYIRLLFILFWNM